MMGFVKKHYGEILIGLLLVAFYFFIRLLFLDHLPIFTDEAIYIRWGQIALHDANWRFISLTDGKQPLFIWIMMFFLRFITDPLLAGRLVSVFSGMVTLVGLGVLAFSLFRSKKIAFVTALLYICYPFAQVHDRLALYDSMVSAFVIWSLVVSVYLVRFVRLDIAYTLGFLIGGGMLTKTNAFFSAILLPVTLLLFPISDILKKKERFFRWVIYALFAVGIAQVLYGILRLSPFFGIIQVKNDSFVYPVAEWIQHPFTYFSGNFHGLFVWLTEYLGWNYLLLILFSFLSWKFIREKLVLFCYFVVPFVALALFGKVIFPRFIFFMSLMFLPIAAEGLILFTTFLQKRVIPKGAQNIQQLLFILVLLVFVLPSLFVTSSFTIDPLHAPITKADKEQYVTGWTAGWGMNEIVSFFQQEAAKGKIFVATQGTFGLLPEVFEMYLVDNPHVTIKGYWPITDTTPVDLQEKAETMPVYIVFYEPCSSCVNTYFAPPLWQVEKVFSPKTPNTTHVTVYKVLPKH